MPVTGGFPEDPLAGIEAEPLSVVEHFFHHDGLPHLLLVVHLRPFDQNKRHSGRRLRDAGPRAELALDERELFDRLRAWRNGRAEADGVPPYVVLTNRQLAEVARRRPTTLTALHEIAGFGDAKTARYGPGVLDVVARESAAPPEAQSDAT